MGDRDIWQSVTKEEWEKDESNDYRREGERCEGKFVPSILRIMSMLYQYDIFVPSCSTGLKSEACGSHLINS